MAVTRIKNNQITDATIVASSKLTDYSISAGKIANNLTYGSNLTISGNLTVNGSTTNIDTNITTIEDPVILLASTASGAPSVDIGFLGQRGSSTNIAFVWDEDQGLFVTAFTDTAETETTINITAYASTKVLNSEVTGDLRVTGASNIANMNVAAASTINFNTSVIGNIGTPVADADAATKKYVDDELSASGFSITDGVTTETVEGGDTIEFEGDTNITVTVDQVSGTESNVAVTLNDSITLTGNITGGNLATGGAVNATGTATLGNVATGGTVSATGNITGGNLATGGAVSATGTATVGNVSTAGTVDATGTITGGNVATGGTVSATGTITSNDTITGGNVATGGTMSATSSITGGSIETATTVSATGTITGGNVATGGTVSATGTATAGNIATGGTVSSTGTATLGNVATGGTISAVGTITSDDTISGGNLATGGTVSSTGTATLGNVATGGTISAASTITGGNVQTGGTISATSTITSADTITGGNIATGGTVSSTGTATLGNVATGGTISSTGTATLGNVASSGFISTTGNVSAGNVNTSDIVGATVTVTSAGAISLAGTEINANSTKILNLADPVNGADAANKQYVDSVAEGLNVKAAVIAATTANITLSGAQTIDGISIVAGNRVLVKDQTAPAENGIYVAAAGAWARSSDMDVWEEFPGAFTFVTTGTEYADTGWVCTSDAGGTLGTTAVTWSQFSGAGQYTAGAGLDLTGTVFSVNVDETTTTITGDAVVVKASAQFVTPNIGAATGTSLSATGTVTADDTITGGNIATGGTVSSTGTATVGNVATGGTISSTGTATAGNLVTGGTLSVTGTATVGNVDTAGTISATSSITGGSVATGGTVSATGTITGGNIATGGTVSSTGTATLGNVATGGTVSATGTITGGNVATGGTVSAVGTITSDDTITGGNIATSGTVSSTGTATLGNVATGGTVSATGTITGGNLATGGTMSSTGTATAGNLATGGTVSATGTITSDDTITGGNVATGGTVSATGTITSDDTITGGNVATGGTVSATGTITSDVTITGGNVATGGTVSATGTITSDDTITGGNLATGGTVSSTGTATVGNVATGGTVSATGTATVGNVATGGTMSATGNITGGNIATAGTSSLGNIRISGDDITDVGGGVVTINSAAADVDFAISGDTTANIFFVDAGTETISLGSATQTTGAILSMNVSTSFLAPVGNTAQRPATGVTGMLRFNTALNSMEVYNNAAWATVGQQEITVITDDQFAGDDSTVAFTLSEESTTAGTIVAINGIQQIPTTAYSVSGTTITFTEAPATGDVIDCRVLTTTTTVAGIADGTSSVDIDGSNGNVIVEVGGAEIAKFQPAGLDVTGSVTGTSFIGVATSAQYADLAENYAADAKYAPGTVVSFGGEAEVTSSTDADTRVAGVVSTNPAYTMNSDLVADHVVTVAFTGRVPCKVTGTVRKGDLMVSAGNGLARAEANPAAGTIIGKALADHDGAEGTIEVVVGRF
jgi:fibronectin-binding autotransporter adhesin